MKTPEKTSPPKEYEQIVEFSFNEKEEKLVVRFLNGSSYSLEIKSLPKKLLTKKPKWDEAVIAPDRGAILVSAGKEVREIFPHYIHSRGQVL